MATTQQPSEALEGLNITSSSEGQRDRGRFVKYLLWMLPIPVLLYSLAFFIVTMPSYERWATSQWGPMLEYAFDTHGQNADVVIFGDSSAFLGIDPRIINAELGINSLLLPDTVGSIPVTEDKPLRNYLEYNRPPRLMVFYFSAWNLDFDNVTEARLFEGEEMMLRHMSAHEIMAFVRHHPTELLVFPLRFFSTFGPKMVRAAMHHVNREKTTAAGLGHVDYNEGFAPLTPACDLPPSFLDHTGTASVQDLVRRYTTPKTDVMVYIAPVPGCRNSAVLRQRSFAAVGAAPPVILPPADFAGDIYYAHMEPGSVPVASRLLARALWQRLEHDASTAVPAGTSSKPGLPASR